MCVYDVNSLETAFAGPFKHQKAQDSIWQPFTKQVPKEQCSPTMTSSSGQRHSPNNFQLKHLSIEPLFSQPILVMSNKRSLKLVVDTVKTKHKNDIQMLFIATEYGTILKYMLLNMNPMLQKSHTPTACLLEEIEVLDPLIHTAQKPTGLINNIILLSQSSSRSLAIATDSSVIKMPIANCQAQTNYFNCLSLMDPYCIWDSKAQKCLFIFQTNETLASSDRETIARNIQHNTHLHQHSINECPMKNIPVDGGFSDWTQWRECTIKTGEKCQCRIRQCDNPAPRNGGKKCDQSAAIEINQCQVHGGWTAWSAWSACKGGLADTCDVTGLAVSSQRPAVRTRFRTCSNPEPKFNGRICIGLDQEEEVCTPDMINPCVRMVTGSQWQPWGPWEACSKNCGGGFQMRRRQCGSKVCLGCNQEWRTCNSESCESRMESIVTDWSRVDRIEGTMQRIEQRSKFLCKFDADLDANGLNGMQVNTSEEFRLCGQGDSGCYKFGKQ